MAVALALDAAVRRRGGLQTFDRRLAADFMFRPPIVSSSLSVRPSVRPSVRLYARPRILPRHQCGSTLDLERGAAAVVCVVRSDDPRQKRERERERGGGRGEMFSRQAWWLQVQ